MVLIKLLPALRKWSTIFCMFFYFCLWRVVHTLSSVELGGYNAQDGQFPFVAHIVLQNLSNKDENILCGATLIHPRWILTAGFCFPTSSEELNNLGKKYEMTVYMGSVDIFSSEAVQNSISQVIRHPKFHYEEVSGEIVLKYNSAVCKLEDSYPIDEFLKPVDLISQYGVFCPKGIITGIGIGIKNQTYSELPNQQLLYHKVYFKREKTLSVKPLPSETTFLATVDRTGDLVPVGDFGGPYICKDHVQYGIISSYFFTEERFIIVFERIDMNLDFIRKHVRSVILAKSNVRKLGPVLTLICLSLLSLYLFEY